MQDRELALAPAEASQVHAGLRYRRTALYPSLHPGILPHLPLVVTVTDRAGAPVTAYEFTGQSRRFAPREPAPPGKAPPCRKLRPELVTYDLRIA